MLLEKVLLIYSPFLDLRCCEPGGSVQDDHTPACQTDWRPEITSKNTKTQTRWRQAGKYLFFFLSWQDLALSLRLVLSSQQFSFLSLKNAKIIDTCHHTQHILLLHFLSLSVIWDWILLRKEKLGSRCVIVFVAPRELEVFDLLSVGDESQHELHSKNLSHK